LDVFLLYKFNLEQIGISSKEFLNELNELMNNEDNYISNVRAFLETVSNEFEEIYTNSFAEKNP
jgi:hypothetical protein